MSPLFFALCVAFFFDSVETDDNESFELYDARAMGIREVVRVTSLHECQLRCRRCAKVILYPDLTCVIFERDAPIIMSSFGTICCYPRANHSFECDQCGPHFESTKDGALVGRTSILGVWAFFDLTNHTYKVLPYNCQATPETYETDCQKEGAHLASIESAEEDQFISSLGTTSCHCKHIGLYSPSSLQQRFRWRDGSKVNYTNWRFGEPFGKGSICAHIWQSSGWASSSCTANGVESVGCCAVCKRHSKQHG